MSDGASSDEEVERTPPPSPGACAPLDWYQEPLFYDMIFEDETVEEANLLLAAHARFALPRPGGAADADAAPLWFLEPACGSGRLVVELARRGHCVTGFDLNAGALAYCRQQLQAARGGGGGVADAATAAAPPAAEPALAAGSTPEPPAAAASAASAADGWGRVGLFEDNMASFVVPADMAPEADAGAGGGGGGFDMAFNLVSSFKHLLDEAEAEAHLRRVAACLRPGGLFVLGLHIISADPADGDESEDESEDEEWVGARGELRVHAWTHSYAPQRQARREVVEVRMEVSRLVEPLAFAWRQLHTDIPRTPGAALAQLLEASARQQRQGLRRRRAGHQRRMAALAHGPVQARFRTVFEMATYTAAQLYALLEAVDDVLQLLQTCDFSYTLVPADPRLNPEQITAMLVLRRR